MSEPTPGGTVSAEGTDEPAPTAPRRRVASVVRAGGDLLFVSGQIALDDTGAVRYPEDAAAQAEVAFTSLSALLVEAGSSMAEVVKVTTYLTDMADLAAVLGVRGRFLGTAVPAATTVQVAALARPGLRIEVEAVATVRGAGPSVI